MALIFKKPNNAPELKKAAIIKPEAPNGLYFKCEKCKKSYLQQDFEDNLSVCIYCGAHFRMGARARIASIADSGTFIEIDKDLISQDILNFPEYQNKLDAAKKQSGENEAVICGTCEINSSPVAIFVMEHRFMMGSMGTVVGEKIARLFEYATKCRLAVVGFTVSGGARMQEGMLSLMQMAKTSGAVKLHSEQNLLYITVITDPTMGGVTASFALEGDIILAEPKASVGFAGARVIENTIRQKLPEGFQTAEFLLEHGFIDAIFERAKLKNTLGQILQLHAEKEYE